jgi:hypothetical protein
VSWVEGKCVGVGVSMGKYQILFSVFRFSCFPLVTGAKERAEKFLTIFVASC